MTLGRDPNQCDVLFDEVEDRVVSRKHAQLRWEDHSLVMVPMPGKVLLRGGVSILNPVTVFSGDVFELAGPGGPAVEVSFDYVIPSPPLPTLQASHFSAVAKARVSTEDAEAPTQKQLVRVSSRSAEQSADVAAPASHLSAPSVEIVVETPLSPPPNTHTMMLEAVDVPASGPSTTFMPILPKRAAPDFVRNRRAPLILAAGAVAIALAGFVFAAWSIYSKSESQRRANERVERLKEAFKELPPVNGVAEDLYGQPRSPGKKALPSPARSPGSDARDVPATPIINDATGSQSDASSTTRTQGRQIFAEWKQLELARLALGSSRSRDVVAKRERIDAKRSPLRAAYEAHVTSIRGTRAVDARTEAILLAARHLGECDATLPPALLERTLRFTQAVSASERSELERSLLRAEERRYTPTITAALGDEGLPLELYFLPHLASHYDELKSGAPTRTGLPKGMWQLAPDVAAKYELALGPDREQSTYDPADDRHRYEKETKAAVKVARDLYQGPAAGSALLVMTFWSNGDPEPLEAAKKRAGISPSDARPSHVSLQRLWESGTLGQREAVAVEALATVAMALNPNVFGLKVSRPFAHVEPEDRR